MSSSMAPTLVQSWALVGLCFEPSSPKKKNVSLRPPSSPKCLRHLTFPNVKNNAGVGAGPKKWSVRGRRSALTKMRGRVGGGDPPAQQNVSLRVCPALTKMRVGWGGTLPPKKCQSEGGRVDLPECPEHRRGKHKSTKKSVFFFLVTASPAVGRRRLQKNTDFFVLLGSKHNPTFTQSCLRCPTSPGLKHLPRKMPLPPLPPLPNPPIPLAEFLPPFPGPLLPLLPT